MDYKPFTEYSDTADRFDQDKFNEASTVSKLKHSAVAKYNEVTAKSVQADNTQAELAGDMGAYEDKFLRAAIVEARTERAMDSLESLSDKERSDLTACLEDQEYILQHGKENRRDIRTDIEEYAGKVGILLDEKGMSEETAQELAKLSLSFYKTAGGAGVGNPANYALPKSLNGDQEHYSYKDTISKVADLNAMDYYSEMKVGQAVLDAEERGETLSADEMNVIGQESIQEMEGFMRDMVAPAFVDEYRSDKRQSAERMFSSLELSDAEKADRVDRSVKNTEAHEFHRWDREDEGRG